MATKQPKSPLVAILFTIFLDLVGFSILIPVIPLLIQKGSPYSIIPSGWSFRDASILLGWLTAIYPLMIFIAAPLLGQLADRVGRKKVLAFCVGGTSIGYVLFAIGVITKNIPLLFFARSLDGITGGNISTAQAIIADVSTPKNRTKNFGLMGMAFGMGFILGPYIGGKLAAAGLPFTIFGYTLFTTPSWFGPSTPFWFTAGLSLFNMLLIITRVPETLKVKATQAFDWTKSLHNIRIGLTTEGLRNVLPSVFLMSAGFTFFTTFFGLILFTKFHFKQSSIGDYFAYVGIWIAVSQGVLVATLAKRVKDYQVLRFSLLGVGLTLIGYYFIQDYHLLFLIAPFLAAFNGLTMANSISIVSRSAPEKMRAQALGISASFQSLGQAIPAIIAGYIGTVSITLPVLVGGGVVVLGAITFWLLYNSSAAYADTDHADAEIVAAH